MEEHKINDNYMTERQWALKGYLKKEGAEGTLLWSNITHNDYFRYYAPEEVRPATKEEIHEFFRPERERRNAKARERRAKTRPARIAEKNRERKLKKIAEEHKLILPYLTRLAELSAKANNGKCQKIVIDTETTGLDPSKGELLQLSIISSDGEILFDSYFKPEAESWPEAQRINHISPEMVKDAPSISDKLVEINEILYQAHMIIGYNVKFDVNFLKASGLFIADETEYLDVMVEFAPIYGDWNDYFANYRWQKLTTAAKYFGYDWSTAPAGAHNSLADCFATLYVFNKIQEYYDAQRRDSE